MEVIGHCRSSGERGYPHSTKGYTGAMNVMQVEGMEGLKYCSAIGGNVIATEIENASWLSYGWETDSLLRWVVARLWVGWVQWKLAQRSVHGITLSVTRSL